MKRYASFIVGLFLLSQLCGFAMAQDGLNITMLSEVHHFVNQASDVAIAGSYAYLASGQDTGLRVLDISDPANPVEIGYAVNTDPIVVDQWWPPGWGIPSSWNAQKVRVSGDYAYVLYFDGFWSFTNYNLYIYDVSDPGAPQQLGHIRVPDAPSADGSSLFVHGNHVYVGGMEIDEEKQLPYSCVKIIDVSDPLQPAAVGEIVPPMREGVNDIEVYVSGNSLYVAADAALLVYDNTHPESPELIAGYPEIPPYVPSQGNATPDSSGVSPDPVSHTFLSVSAKDNYVFALDCDYGLRVLDISDLSDIQEVGSFQKPEPEEPEDPGPRPPDNGDQPVYWGGNGVQTPDLLGMRPHLKQGLDVPVWAVSWGQVRVADDLLFFYQAGDFDNTGLMILDISQPEEPELMGMYTVPAYSWGWGYDCSGGYAFVANGALGLSVVDVRYPSSPREVGLYKPLGLATGLTVSGDYAYLATYGSPDIDGRDNLSIYDVSDPSAPAKVTSLTFEGVPKWPSVHNDYLFVPGLSRGMMRGVSILDISNPTAPSEVSSLLIPEGKPGAAWRVELYDKYAFVACAHGGVQIYDISDITQPICAGEWSTWDRWDPINGDEEHPLIINPLIKAVKIAWPYMFVPCGIYGLYVLDVSDPGNIVEVGSVDTPGSAGYVALTPDGKYAYIGDSVGGVRIIDVSDPQTPKEIGSVDYDFNTVENVAVFGNHLYVTQSKRTPPALPVFAQFAGADIHVFDITDPAAPVAVASLETPGVKLVDMDFANDLVYVSDRTHFEIFEMGRDDTPTAVENDQSGEQNIPGQFALRQNYPNPFNPATTIAYDLHEASDITLTIYTITGQQVAVLVNTHQKTGHHTIRLDGSGFANGVYLYRLEAGGLVETRRMMLIK